MDIHEVVKLVVQVSFFGSFHSDRHHLFPAQRGCCLSGGLWWWWWGSRQDLIVFCWRIRVKFKALKQSEFWRQHKNSTMRPKPWTFALPPAFFSTPSPLSVATRSSSQSPASANLNWLLASQRSSGLFFASTSLRLELVELALRLYMCSSVCVSLKIAGSLLG